MSVWYLYSCFLLFFFEFRQEKVDAHNEEDNKKAGDVDENRLSILERIFLVRPDGFLQVPHESGCGRQDQNGGAEVLVDRQ